MIIVMHYTALPEEIEAVKARLVEAGLQAHLSQGVSRTIIGVIGNDTKTRLPEMALEVMPGVEKVVPILQSYKLAGREFKPENTVIKIRHLSVGGDEIHVMAGPCAVESREQILEAAHQVKQGGATMLRGGAFKPRTSPYSFQGLEEQGLQFLAEAGEVTGLPVVTEVMDTRSLRMVADYADVVQIGARNMQNFNLLREAGKQEKPVLLKRGISATIEEWILAAEYIMSGGNYNVMLCERGIRTYETYTRNTLDLSAVPVAKQLTHLPVIIDPSHGTGKWQLVDPMSRAAIAAGADGLIVEVHPNPSKALSDGAQSLNPEKFSVMMNKLDRMAAAMDRRMAGKA